MLNIITIQTQDSDYFILNLNFVMAIQVSDFVDNEYNIFLSDGQQLNISLHEAKKIVAILKSDR